MLCIRLKKERVRGDVVMAVFVTLEPGKESYLILFELFRKVV